MIDPISALSACTMAADAISKSIKAGKDLHSLSGPISRYAKAEAELNVRCKPQEEEFLCQADRRGASRN